MYYPVRDKSWMAYCNWISAKNTKELAINVKKIGEDGYELVKKLNADPMIKSVRIKGKIDDPVAVVNILHVLKGFQVKCLSFGHNFITSDVAQSLSKDLKYINITCLILCSNSLSGTGVKYLTEILKDTSITDLYIEVYKKGPEFITYLAEGLKNTNIIKLYVRNVGKPIESIKCLANVLPETNITTLTLRNRFVLCLEEIEYFIEQLKNSCVTHIELLSNQIELDAIDLLVQSLDDTQVTEFGNYYLVPGEPSAEVIQATSKNKLFANKIQIALRKLVKIPEHGNLEFIIPTGTENLDIGEYLNFIKDINDNLNVKGHLFDYINHLGLISSKIIRKINEFVIAICEKFNTFFNMNFLDLEYLLGDINYTELVKQCDDMGLHDIVKNLLLHRELYYVDDHQKILYPFIYKMLNKHGMAIYWEQFEPTRREDILSFYENHSEIEGAQEIGDFI